MSSQQVTNTPDVDQDLLHGDHVYDGIQEYDNPTPGWWTMIFIGTVVFSAVYWFISIMSNGGLSAQHELAADVQAENMKLFGSLGDINEDAPTMLKFAADPKWRGVGESIFIGKCAACHGKNGEGINGANLTDDKYIHVKKMEDIIDVIKAGRNNGAMPSWRSTLNKNEIIMVASYAASLRGTNKPGKAPEPNAVAIDPWPAQ